MSVLNHQQIIEASPVAMCLHDSAGHIRYTNSTFNLLLGFDAKDLQHKPMLDLVALDYQQVHLNLTKQTENTNHPVDLPFIHKQGHRIWLAESLGCFNDAEHGELFISQFIDIDERKKEEMRLHLTEDRFNLSQQHASYGVWDWNIQTNDLYWSEQIGPLIGLGSGEIEANYMDFMGAMHPDDRDYMAEAVRAAVEDGAEYNIEHRVVWPDGTVRWLLETGDVIRDESGTPLSMIGVARDVTEHHLDSEALRQSEELLKTAQAIAHVGHWSWDVESGQLYWSDEIFRIFGYNPGEVEPTYDLFISLLHPDDLDRIKQSEEKAFAEGKPHSIDHRIIRPDGTVAWVHEEAIAITNDSKHPVKLTGTVQDISERKQLEQKLADKITQAESANLSKSTFLSHMSHELRTPLNGILGFAQILEMDSLPEKSISYIQEIKQSGWHLLELVDDLLDLSRIETGNIDLQLMPVDLGKLVNECQSMITPMMEDRRLNFSAQYHNCDTSVMADKRRLKQILINLLTNAVKYNRPGGLIEVYCKQYDERYRIHVRDTGQGIPAELMDRLFTPFDRLGKEGIEESGSGIGLALVKRLTEAMDGEIGVETKVGEGSTFWVEFNLAQNNQDSVAENNNKTLEKVKMTTNAINILYVEDNPANLRFMEGYVSNHKHINLCSAVTAMAGLELAKRQRPDVILMDIKLPDMSGFEALAKLKVIPETSDIPIIAVSAVAHDEDVAAGINAGFFRYVTKPINLQQLEDALYSALSSNDVRTGNEAS